MTTQEKTLDIFHSVGAFLENDHFIYTSGKHGSIYINKDAVYPHPQKVAELCQLIAEQLREDNIHYDVVVGPEKGGIILAQWLAHATGIISPDRNPLAVYAEKDGTAFVLKRGYDLLVKDKQVLIIEDNLTTGSSVKKVGDAVRANGGDVVGIVALCNRGNVTKEAINAPYLFSLLNLRFEDFEPSACPLCQTGSPINRQVGKGKLIEKES